MARRLHADGDLDAAEKHYRKILRKRPRHPEALHLLGLIANQRGENQTALDLIQQSVRIKSDEPYYYNNLGLVLNALGRYEEAGECYRKALGLDAQLPYVHANLAAAMHRHTDALVSFRKAVDIDPDCAEARFGLALGSQLAATASSLRGSCVAPSRFSSTGPISSRYCN